MNSNDQNFILVANKTYLLSEIWDSKTVYISQNQFSIVVPALE